mgnify:FL=1
MRPYLNAYLMPDALRAIAKQGATEAAPHSGVREPMTQPLRCTLLQ